MSKQNKLSREEQKDLDRLVKTVNEAIETVQKDLLKLKEGGIWRSSHKTFEDYCSEKFGFHPLELDVEGLIRKLEKVSS